MTVRLKVLVCAYACEPGKGSEPGVGWNVAKELAKHHDIWVLTRASNRAVIDAELAKSPVPNLQLAFYDLPVWARWWKKGGRGAQLYYYLWQLASVSAARALHRHVGFDASHHLTFVKYWAPSAAAIVGLPFVWGPVGGGESTPGSFFDTLSPAGRLYERLRSAARWVGERDPLVRFTARRSGVAFATTRASAERMRAIGATNVRVLPAVGIGHDDLSDDQPAGSVSRPGTRFVSVGRLLPLKAFNLALRAFAAADLSDSEYWVIGDGPEREHLESLALSLGVADRVTFLGQVSRGEVLQRLRACTALVHPSLHESGGWVSLEAMAAGKPVICLDLGGLALQVTASTGFKVGADNPDQAVTDIAHAMRRLAMDSGLAAEMGAASIERVSTVFDWAQKARVIGDAYVEVVTQNRDRT